MKYSWQGCWKLNKNKNWMYIWILGIIVLILSGCQAEAQENPEAINITDIPIEKPGNATIKEFKITAQKTNWQIKGQTIEAWTYNGTVPGEEIRVQEGDWVKVHLKNELDEPVTIHWHGMVLPNQMDGVAGVTQNAIQPGGTFTYEFHAKEAGTYWYHSHQKSHQQVDRGLYGALIIEAKQKTFDRDHVLILDEWAIGSNSQGMMHGGMMGGNGTPGEMDSQMLYETFTVNGKSYPDIRPLEVKPNEKVRFRIINAGYQKHVLNFNDHPYKVVANDGKKVVDSTLTEEVLLVAPGERIDIEFEESGSKDWMIDSPNLVEAKNDMIIPVDVIGTEDVNKRTYHDQNLKLIDYTEHGRMESVIDKTKKPDVEYKMDLSAGMGMMQSGMVYKINGKLFPDTPPINVNKGDLVKVTITNNSMLDHPMHLHGHYFEVISRNGQKLENPLVKDIINVEPHERYEILFTADNPGDWVFHCHDLIHATGGMVTVLNYNGYFSPFELEGKYHNQPE